jgi:hypothetical protein
VNIAATVSAASSCRAAVTWLYVSSVIPMFAWPDEVLDGWGYCSSGVRFRIESELITDINDGGVIEGVPVIWIDTTHLTAGQASPGACCVPARARRRHRPPSPRVPLTTDRAVLLVPSPLWVYGPW